MWVWNKNIPTIDEKLWTIRLASLRHVVFTTLPRSSRIRVQCYCENLIEAAALLAAFGGSLKEEQDRDWVAATAPEHERPLLVRNRLVVAASQVQCDLMRKRYPRRQTLYFPAECAFGTGNHGTTATCLRMLCDESEKRRGQQWRLIDVGCGTGILGLAALRLGASQALCFDDDATAVEVAQRNVARNGGAPGMRVFQADVFEWMPSAQERASIVVANLFSGLLQRAFTRFRHYLTPEADSVLIVSGILREQEHDTLVSAEQAEFSLLHRAVCGKWVTLKLLPRP